MKSFAVPFLALMLTPFCVVPAVAEALRCAPVAVVELFTSQGCSSCPPADAVLKELGEREDVIALAYHVDYWDYIGWEDTFGDAAFSDLQRGYATAQGSARIYTPQMIVNGAVDVVGSRRADVDDALEAARLPLFIDLETEGDMLKVSAGGLAGRGEAAMWLVTYKKNVTVDITAGENRDRAIEYSHIVTGRTILGMWDPVEGAKLRLPLSEVLGEDSDGAAILVQQEIGGFPGPILAAASFTR